MIRKLIIIGAVAAICSTAFAEGQQQQQGQGAVVSEWLKALQKKIEQIMPKKSLYVTTGVAGVRGAKEEGQAKLYWKGKKGEEVVTEEELVRFKKAVDIAASGDRASAVKELEEFMKQYPDSGLIPDAKKTLDLVKTEAK